jgi:hypothetical protein
MAINSSFGWMRASSPGLLRAVLRETRPPRQIPRRPSKNPKQQNENKPAVALGLPLVHRRFNKQD